MSTATLISVEAYVGTSYRPDCDYVDGILEERNVGQKDHSRLQRKIIVWFDGRGRALRLEAFPEQRIQVNPTRFRVPDICVVQLPVPDEQIFTEPPYICIEVLSPDDRFLKLQERLDDYLAMGVPNIWVFDPETRRGWRIVREGHLEVLDGALHTSDLKVTLPLADLFSQEE